MKEKPKRKKALVFSLLGIFLISTIFLLVFFVSKNKNQARESVQFSQIINDNIDTDGDGLLDREENTLGTNIYDKDTDKDGFEDGEEVQKGYNPLRAETDINVDVDGDGLIGKDEEKYGTDPKLKDTDFDGFTDGEEVASGNDPLKSNLSDMAVISALSDYEESDIGDDNVIDVTSEDYEKIGYLEDAFSSQDIYSLQDSMSDYIEAESGAQTIEGELTLPEISDEDINIGSDSSQESMQNYINSLGDIFYQNLGAESSIGSYDLTSDTSAIGAGTITQFSLSISNILERTQSLSVPDEENLVDIHKNLLASLTKSNSLIDQIIEDSNSSDEQSTVNVMNGFAELAYILKSRVVEETLVDLDTFAYGLGLSLPEYKFN